MSVRSDRAARERNRKIELMLKTLQPMRGGPWLAFDRSTGFHWTLDIAEIRLAPGVRYTGPGTGSAGIVTLRSRSGDAIFQIEEADTLLWDESERCLRVKEGGFRRAEIVLGRIGDLDLPLVSADELGAQADSSATTRAIEVDGLYAIIDALFLSTGDAEIDATLTVIESSLLTRSGDHGTLSNELVQGMAARLNEIALNPRLRSYVWLTALRQQLARLARTLDA